MTEGGDKARAEFLSEAQELVENLSRNLLSLEQGRAGGGRIDPEYLNEAFRSVHTLKSLSGLFGDKHMSQLSHRLEDLLDDLRLGRQNLSDAVLDLLFTSVDVYWQILTSSDAQEVRGVQEILDRLEKLAPHDRHRVRGPGALRDRHGPAGGADRIRGAPAAGQRQAGPGAVSGARAVRAGHARQGPDRDQGQGQAVRRGDHLSARRRGGEPGADRARSVAGLAAPAWRKSRARSAGRRSTVRQIQRKKRPTRSSKALPRPPLPVRPRAATAMPQDGGAVRWPEGASETTAPEAVRRRGALALGEPDGARRHPQARRADERRRQARRAARRVDRAHRPCALRGPAPAGVAAVAALAQVRAQLARAAERHPRGAHGAAGAGLRAPDAHRAQDRQGSEQRRTAGGHRRGDRDRQADRGRAQRSADAHHSQRDRPRHRRRARSASASASPPWARSR